MRYTARVAIVILALVGCSHSSRRPSIAQAPYIDQRVVTTRPAGEPAAQADFVLRVEERMGQPYDAKTMPKTVPADAKLIVSAETLVKRKTPFYATVLLPEHRIELGGLLHSAISDDPNLIRMDIGFADHARLNHVSTTANLMIKTGETAMLTGCSNGLYVTLVLEPIVKPNPK